MRTVRFNAILSTLKTVVTNSYLRWRKVSRSWVIFVRRNSTATMFAKEKMQGFRKNFTRPRRDAGVSQEENVVFSATLNCLLWAAIWLCLLHALSLSWRHTTWSSYFKLIKKVERCFLGRTQEYLSRMSSVCASSNWQNASISGARATPSCKDNSVCSRQKTRRGIRCFKTSMIKG